MSDTEPSDYAGAFFKQALAELTETELVTLWFLLTNHAGVFMHERLPAQEARSTVTACYKGGRSTRDLVGEDRWAEVKKHHHQKEIQLLQRRGVVVT